MFSFLVIAALAAAATATPLKSQVAYPSGRIIGGNDAVIEAYPYQVSLQFDDSHLCGASIISSNYVLTAGHCIVGDASDYSVRAGTTYHSNGGSIHEVEKLIRHEKYYTNAYGVPFFDIAIVKVKTPFKFDDTRQPIELYNLKEESNTGDFAMVTGWGSTGGWGLPDELKTVSIPIITKELCSKAYGDYGGIPEGQICAAYYGEGGKDACQGDSGGPLAIDGRLAGIVSWGNGCAKPYYPGVYTEVAHYRDWINEHAEF